MISLKKVNKSYGSNELKQEVLNDLSFDFKKGTTYSIVGPSGSGKTTFLNILSGLDVFDNGSIKIENVELSHLNQDELSKLRKDNFSFAYQIGRAHV